MPIFLKLKIDPKRWKSTAEFKARYKGRYQLAMNMALAVLQAQVRLNLSGPSHVDFPGNGNPFPGTRTGRLKNSVNVKQRITSGNVIGIIGPNVKYARAHEFGLGVPKRPYLKPALEKRRRKIQEIFDQANDDLMKGKQ